MGALKEKLIEGGLPAEIWPAGEPVMVAEFSHFGGDYPELDQAHNCKTYWRAKVVDDYVTGMAPVNYELWRHIITKKGELLHCPTCWHERVVGFCQGIERVSLYYRERDALRYLIVDEDNRKKTADRIRKHNQRVREGAPQVTYTTFPLEDDQIVFLHDGGDYTGGNTLPDNRQELFELVHDWANTPKGKRAGHGIKAWIKNGSKTKPLADDTQQDVDEQPKEKSKPGNGGQRVGYIYGSDWWLICRLIAEHMGKSVNSKGMKFSAGELHVLEFQELLETFDIDYAVEGMVTLRKTDDETANDEHPAPIPEPAPLLL